MTTVAFSKKCLSLKKIGLFFIFCVSLFSCATDLSPMTKSGIDADFKFKKILATAKNDSESPSVSFYQRTLRSSLYTECEYFPSDSVYSQAMAKRCGTAASLFKTFSRFILESDAAYLGLPIRPTTAKYKFIDLPDSCEIF